MMTRLWTAIVVTACILLALSSRSSAVEKWRLHEIKLKAAKTYENPFKDCVLTAELIHATSGAELTAQGFHDGNGSGGQVDVKCPIEQFTEPGYRMGIEAFFAHPPSFSAMHSDSDARPADWPAKVGPLSYSVIHQRGYSTDSIWIAATDVVPRCTMHDPQHNPHTSHSGVLVRWSWLKKPEFDLFIGVAPRRDILRCIKRAAGVE